MALFERIISESGDKIPSHQFFSYLHIILWNSAGLGSAAVTLAKSNMNIENGSDELTDFNALKTTFDALANDDLKQEFIGRIHAAVMLAEIGDITKAQMGTLLGL